MPSRLLLLVSLAAAACGVPAPPRPPERPARIVSLLPAFTEILADLGASERLVGCTEHCRPGREVVPVAWQGAEGAEAIVRLRPDLVLRQMRRNGEDPLLWVLGRAGIPALALPSETVADVRAAILAIGRAVGIDPAPLLERFDHALAAATSRGESRTDRSVLFVYGRDPGVAANIQAAGPGSFLDELIRLAGGRNALGEGWPAYASVSLEALVRLAPAVIVDNVPPEKSVEGARAAWSRYRDLPAVRDGRVHAVLDPQLLIPGPRLPDAVARLAELIHGEP
ncbi:MAG: ABC transporter substrate-binding protein [Planctomycetaceae bacterium]